MSVILFASSYLSFADPITISTSGVSSKVLGPSGDSLSLEAGSGTYDSTSGLLTFQVGDFIIGNSNIPDQAIKFWIDELLTLNGISQDLTLFGQDNVTTTSDTLTIFGGTPVIIGGQTFTLQTFSISGDDLGDYPIALQASVVTTPTPEPNSLLLVGSGLIGASLIVARRSHSAMN